MVHKIYKNLYSKVCRDGGVALIGGLTALILFFAFYANLVVSPDALDHLRFATRAVQNVRLFGPLPDDFSIQYIHFYKSGYGYHLLLRALGELLDFISFGSFKETLWFEPPFMQVRKLSNAGEMNLLFLGRLLSVGMTLIQFWLIKKICEVLNAPRLLPLVMLWLGASIMFTYLHGNVSRDVLVNLLATWLLYSVLAYRRLEDPKYIRHALLCMAVAPMILLSLSAFCVVVIVSLAIADRATAKKAFFEIMNVFQLKHGLAFLIALLLLATPSILDVSNKLIRYHTVHPACERIFNVETCVAKHANYRVQKKLEKQTAQLERISHVKYIGKWYPALFKRTFGITGHKSYPVPKVFGRNLMYLATGLFLISFFLAVRRKEQSFIFLCLISVFFLGMVYMRNRGVYVRTGTFNVALHGRYYFAAYPAFLLALNYVFLKVRLRHYSLYLFIMLAVATYAYAKFFTYPAISKLLAI